MESITVRRADSLEIERFKAMLESPAFARLKKRIEAELERARGECETATEPAEVYRKQGNVKALRTVLELPRQILEDMKRR